MIPMENNPPNLELMGTRPQGRVLKGKYVGAFRSSKGKLKGLRLESGGQEYTIKLPKYLRPILVRELVPQTFVQVWAYPDEDIWRGINVLPLSEAEARSLHVEASTPQATPVPQETRSKTVRIQVCSKGKCFKQGGRAIWQTLKAEAEANPHLQNIVVESTGCMKACKAGPNMRILPRGTVLSNLTTAKALAILSECR